MTKCTQNKLNIFLSRKTFKDVFYTVMSRGYCQIEHCYWLTQCGYCQIEHCYWFTQREYCCFLSDSWEKDFYQKDIFTRRKAAESAAVLQGNNTILLFVFKKRTLVKKWAQFPFFCYTMSYICLSICKNCNWSERFQ